MNWIELIASLVDSLAWPGAVIYAIYILKDRIGELLPRLKKLKHKDTEIEFEQGIRELEDRMIEGELAIEKIEDKSEELGEDYEFFMRLAKVSSRSAVMESFLKVESAMAKALTKAYPELKKAQYFSPRDVEEMLKTKVGLSDQVLARIRVLRRLRNTAAHAKEFDLSGMPIESYIENALSISNELNRYAP